MAAEMRFAENHNLVGLLVDPLIAYEEFKSMVKGLNSYRITKALRTNPVLHRDLITEFWKNAKLIEAGANGAGSIDSKVKGSDVAITEELICKVLDFGDRPGFPTEYAADKVLEALKQMCCEGSYPPTIKKLLLPFWRFLAHTYVMCISGRKGGSDEISQTVSSAIVSLVMEWDYYFSKYVFMEMQSNLVGKKKNPFLMYPRFLQMIFDEEYPQLEIN